MKRLLPIFLLLLAGSLSAAAQAPAQALVQAPAQTSTQTAAIAAQPAAQPAARTAATPAQAPAKAPAQPSRKATDAHLFGHVIDSRTGEHLPYVTIAIVGTTMGVTTDATGHYLIKNIPFGDYTVEAKALGYSTERKKVSIHRSETVELHFEIAEQAVTMDQVVVSASRSERLKREAPSLVNVLDGDLFVRTSASSLAGGLSFQPGVRVENTCQNCGFPQVRINGLDGRYS